MKLNEAFARAGGTTSGACAIARVTPAKDWLAKPVFAFDNTALPATRDAACHAGAVATMASPFR